MLTVAWEGGSGRLYQFEVWDTRTKLQPVPGVYIFTRHTQGQYRALFLGETHNLADRIKHHESWDQAIAQGMNQVHLLARSGDRHTILRDLLEKWA